MTPQPPPPGVPPLVDGFAEFDYLGYTFLKGDLVRKDVAVLVNGAWNLRADWDGKTIACIAIRRGTELHRLNFPAPQEPALHDPGKRFRETKADPEGLRTMVEEYLATHGSTEPAPPEGLPPLPEPPAGHRWVYRGKAWETTDARVLAYGYPGEPWRVKTERAEGMESLHYAEAIPHAPAPVEGTPRTDAAEDKVNSLPDSLRTEPLFCTEEEFDEVIDLCRTLERESAAKDATIATLTAEAARLRGIVDYAYRLGLHVAIGTSTDCPEGRLQHDYRDGTELGRLFDEWSDSIGWEKRQKRLTEDLAAARGALEPFAAYAKEYEGHRSNSVALGTIGRRDVLVSDFHKAEQVFKALAAEPNPQPGGEQSGQPLGAGVEKRISRRELAEAIASGVFGNAEWIALCRKIGEVSSNFAGWSKRPLIDSIADQLESFGILEDCGEAQPEAGAREWDELCGNLQEWADEFRKQQHPATLTLLRALKVLRDGAVHEATEARSQWLPIEEADKSKVQLVNDTTGITNWCAAKWLECEGWSGWAYDDEPLSDSNPTGPRPTLFFPLPAAPARDLDSTR